MTLWKWKAFYMRKLHMQIVSCWYLSGPEARELWQHFRITSLFNDWLKRYFLKTGNFFNIIDSHMITSALHLPQVGMEYLEPPSAGLSKLEGRRFLSCMTSYEPKVSWILHSFTIRLSVTLLVIVSLLILCIVLLLRFKWLTLHTKILLSTQTDQQLRDQLHGLSITISLV